MGSSPHVWFLYLLRRLLGKWQLVKIQKNAHQVVDFQAEHCHFGERWSF